MEIDRCYLCVNIKVILPQGVEIIVVLGKTPVASLLSLIGRDAFMVCSDSIYPILLVCVVGGASLCFITFLLCVYLLQHPPEENWSL